MKRLASCSRSRVRRQTWTALRTATAACLLAVFPGGMEAQATGAVAAPTAQAGQERPAATPSHASAGARRRAARVYLDGSKLFLAGQFDQARADFERASALDPANPDYRQAALVARSHEVTALVEAAAKDRLRGDASAARSTLLQAYSLDPTNFEVTQHLDELGSDIARAQAPSPYAEADARIGGAIQLVYAKGLRSFHLRGGERRVIEDVFKGYGVDAMIDQSVGDLQVRFDIGDATFDEVTRALGLLTDSFYVPLDEHRVLVARNTPNNRERFMREDLETVYVPGLSSDTLGEIANLARNVFQVQRAVADPSNGTVTLRAPQLDLDAFNSTMHELMDGSSQIVLDVRMLQIAHTSTRNTGVQPPQSITAFNVYAEEQSILNANQSLVQEIISSGLAAPGDTLAILAILLASGQVSSSLFSNGLALFGGGLTQSALVPGSITANFNLNTSDTREVDDIRMRLGDGQDGTLKLGTRYPIETSQYSSLGSNTSSLAGLTSAGTSSSLSSLLGQLNAGALEVPQIQYQDLGLTLKVTPKVLRNGDVVLSLDLTLDGLAGTSVNGLPVLSNRAYSGVVMLRQGAAAVLASELDQSESRAITGTPGISEIPGMNNLTGKDFQKNYATLLIVITPHVVRGTQAAGHSPMFRVVGTGITP